MGARVYEIFNKKKKSYSNYLNGFIIITTNSLQLAFHYIFCTQLLINNSMIIFKHFLVRLVVFTVEVVLSRNNFLMNTINKFKRILSSIKVSIIFMKPQKDLVSITVALDN